MTLTRRNMVKGLAGSIIGAAGLISLSASSPQQSASASEDSGLAATGADGSGSNFASKVSETKSCDVVVVGAGISGLAAAVEALNGGASVIVLESQDAPGGSGLMTKCIAAVGSDEQKAGKITAEHEDSWQALVLSERPTTCDYRVSDIVSHELATFNYTVDGARWCDLLSNSAQNIKWLREQGALIEEAVDNYHCLLYTSDAADE